MAFRPTWRGVVGGVLVVLVALVCVRLGLWQLDRLDQRRARNAAYREAMALPILELRGDTLEAVRLRPDEYVYRRARVLGAPDAAGEVVWRGRSLDGRPGVNILTPYRVDGSTVLVNRGWAPSADAAHVALEPLREETGRAPVGVLIPLGETSGRGVPRPLEMNGRVLSVARPELASLADHLPDLLPLYVQQLPAAGDPAAPVRLPVPDLRDEGPHLGYAFQWFAFAIIACVGFLIVVLLRRRADRD